MANLKRLTNRVNDIEKWIAENGDGDNMANMHYLLRSLRQAGEMLQNEQMQSQQFKSLVFEWMKERDLGEDWDKFVEEKQNALQEQETESVSVRNEPEASEGVREEDAEEQKTTE